MNIRICAALAVTLLTFPVVAAEFEPRWVFNREADDSGGWATTSILYYDPKKDIEYDNLDLSFYCTPHSGRIGLYIDFKQNLLSKPGGSEVGLKAIFGKQIRRLHGVITENEFDSSTGGWQTEVGIDDEILFDFISSKNLRIEVEDKIGFKRDFTLNGAAAAVASMIDACRKPVDDTERLASDGRSSGHARGIVSQERKSLVNSLVKQGLSELISAVAVDSLSKALDTGNTVTMELDGAVIVARVREASREKCRKGEISVSSSPAKSIEFKGIESCHDSVQGWSIKNRGQVKASGRSDAVASKGSSAPQTASTNVLKPLPGGDYNFVKFSDGLIIKNGQYGLNGRLTNKIHGSFNIESPNLTTYYPDQQVVLTWVNGGTVCPGGYWYVLNLKSQNAQNIKSSCLEASVTVGGDENSPFVIIDTHSGKKIINIR